MAHARPPTPAGPSPTGDSIDLAYFEGSLAWWVPYIVTAVAPGFFASRAFLLDCKSHVTIAISLDKLTEVYKSVLTQLSHADTGCDVEYGLAH